MKTLFFIAALAGAVYLIMQTPAGKAWWQKSEPELHIQQQKPHKKEKISTQLTQVSQQVADTVENKMTEFAQHLNQKQQVQINRLENRIAELENELIMGRIAQKQQQQQTVSSSNVTLHPYKQPEQQFIVPPSKQISKKTSKQDLDLGTQTPDILAANSNNTLQRKRQARLQDIAQKMEMSSLQALVN